MAQFASISKQIGIQGKNVKKNKQKKLETSERGEKIAQCLKFPVQR